MPGGGSCNSSSSSSPERRRRPRPSWGQHARQVLPLLLGAAAWSSSSAASAAPAPSRDPFSHQRVLRLSNNKNNTVSPFTGLADQQHHIGTTTFRAATRCGAYETTMVAPVEGGQPVALFVGLRFTDPLTPAHRWQPPPPLFCAEGASADVIKAMDWGPRCLQYNGEGEEDCLKLNVHVPQALAARLPQTYQNPDERLEDADLLPVIVYIHGGGLVEGGSAGLPLWDVAGADPAGTGGGPAVVVSFHYRLGVHGFLAVEDLSEEAQAMGRGRTSGNYGLLDQQAALRWVQEHIRAFGGDPARITIIGQSSGGTSVLALLASPASKGLFHRAISLSGSPNITMGLPAAHAQNQPLLATLGCSAADGYPTREQRLTCLRALPAKEVARAMPWAWTIPGMNGLPLSPAGQGYYGVPVVDGQVLAMPVLDALLDGVVDVPVMIGNMAQEVDAWPADEVEALSNPEWRAFLRRWFRKRGFGELAAPKIADGLARLYQNESDRDPQMAFDSIVSDYGLTCGSLLLGTAAAASRKRTQPAYVFVNEWAPTLQGMYDPSETSEASSWIPVYEKVLGFAIVGIAALVGLMAACCKKPTRGSKTNATATVSPVSPSTPSPETPASSLPPTPVPTTLGAGSEKDAPSGTPVHPDDPRRRGKGKLAGGLFLALGLLGVVMAVGLGSTDLFRPKRVVRYAYHLWDLMAWMRIHERAPASAANATALATGDEGLSRLLRDAVYQFAADGRIDLDTIDWRPIDPTTALPAGTEGSADDSVTSIAFTALAPPSASNMTFLADPSNSIHNRPFPRPAVFVLRDTQQWPYLPSSTVEGYKSDVCGFLYSHGFDQRFWWCN